MATLDTPAFVQAVCRWRAGEIAEEEVVRLLAELEHKHRVQLVVPALQCEATGTSMVVRGDARFEHLEEAPDELVDSLFEELFYPFLNETWAILLSSFPDGSDVVFENRYFFPGTARARAHVICEWANTFEWQDARWQYTDFLYSQGLDEDFYRWLEDLRRLVRKKLAVAAD